MINPSWSGGCLLIVLVTFGGQQNSKMWQIHISKISSTCKTWDIFWWFQLVCRSIMINRAPITHSQPCPLRVLPSIVGIFLLNPKRKHDSGFQLDIEFVCCLIASVNSISWLADYSNLLLPMILPYCMPLWFSHLDFSSVSHIISISQTFTRPLTSSWSRANYISIRGSTQLCPFPLPFQNNYLHIQIFIDPRWNIVR